MLIVAVVRANGLTLITHNAREFGRIAGMKLKIGKSAMSHNYGEHNVELGSIDWLDEIGEVFS